MNIYKIMTDDEIRAIWSTARAAIVKNEDGPRTTKSNTDKFKRANREFKRRGLTVAEKLTEMPDTPYVRFDYLSYTRTNGYQFHDSLSAARAASGTHYYSADTWVWHKDKNAWVQY